MSKCEREEKSISVVMDRARREDGDMEAGMQKTVDGTKQLCSHVKIIINQILF